MSAICDAHKVGVELIYNTVHRKYNQFGDQTSWRQDAVEKASTQQREPSGPRLISWGLDELDIRCGRENWNPERLAQQAPGWAAQENGKETRLWPILWGSICCSSVRSPTPSHTQPFQLKWKAYFSKNWVACLYWVVVMNLHMSIQHNNFWKAPWKFSCVSVSMTFVTASFISSIVS